LPKKDGRYWCYGKPYENILLIEFNNDLIDHWMYYIDWYLLPKDLPTDAEANNKACHIYANVSNPDDKILAFIEGWEAYRDKLLNKQ